MKMFLSLVIALTCTISRADAVKISSHLIDGMRLTEIIQKDDGSIFPMSFQAAYKYCHDLGGQLPTAHQYAELATQFGAKGIVETKFPNAPTFPQWGYPPPSLITSDIDKEIYGLKNQGYVPEHASWVVNGSAYSDTDVVDFYFSNAGYSRPIYETLGADDLWTYTGDNLSYRPAHYSGFYGDISTDERPEETDGVRCLVK